MMTSYQMVRTGELSMKPVNQGELINFIPKLTFVVLITDNQNDLSDLIHSQGCDSPSVTSGAFHLSRYKLLHSKSQCHSSKPVGDFCFPDGHFVGNNNFSSNGPGLDQILYPAGLPKMKTKISLYSPLTSTDLYLSVIWGLRIYQTSPCDMVFIFVSQR